MTEQRGHSAYRLVAEAASDVLAVAWASNFAARLFEGWAESSEARRRELWADAAYANDALRERFRERFEALPIGED